MYNMCNTICTVNYEKIILISMRIQQEDNNKYNFTAKLAFN